jgi:hypothetical protein
MTADERFERAVQTYRVQVLEAIDCLRTRRSFAAVTLACCAIDLLTHVYCNPSDETWGKEFKKTVRKKLIGYSDEDIPELLCDLRCGLVHEFRTGSRYEDGTDLFLSDHFNEPPRRDTGKVVFSVQHLCDAVREAFEKLFQSGDGDLRKRFYERVNFIVVEVDASSDLGNSTHSTPASGVITTS